MTKITNKTDGGEKTKKKKEESLIYFDDISNEFKVRKKISVYLKLSFQLSNMNIETIK